MNREFGQYHRYLLGLDTPPLVQCMGASVLPELVPALESMQWAAHKAGFELAIASGHRDFARQLQIFNGKASGQRALLGADGRPLERAGMTEVDLLHAILRWSALPGTSRHHWGTDIDVYDKSVCSDHYAVQLTQQECEGPMAAFHAWLDGYLAHQGTFDRPYAQDRGGVAPEPWHLSFTALAQPLTEAFDRRLLSQALAASDIALKPLILSELPALVQRYVYGGTADA